MDFYKIDRKLWEDFYNDSKVLLGELQNLEANEKEKRKEVLESLDELEAFVTAICPNENEEQIKILIENIRKKLN